jgi:hypothetical protein
LNSCCVNLVSEHPAIVFYQQLRDPILISVNELLAV